MPPDRFLKASLTSSASRFTVIIVSLLHLTLSIRKTYMVDYEVSES